MCNPSYYFFLPELYYDACYLVTGTHEYWEPHNTAQIYYGNSHLYMRSDMLKGLSLHPRYKPLVGDCKPHELKYVHLLYTANISSFTLLLAAINVLPILFSLYAEDDTISKVIGKMRHENENDPSVVYLLMNATDALIYSSRQTYWYIIWHHLTPLFYSFVFGMTFIGMNIILLFRFVSLPSDMVHYAMEDMHLLEPSSDIWTFFADPESPNPARQLFPLNAMCGLAKSGNTAERVHRKATCDLAPNDFMYAAVLPLWFLIVVGITVSFATLLYNIIPLCIPRLRRFILKSKVLPRGKVDAVTVAKKIAYHQYRFLLLLDGPLLENTFTKLVKELAMKMEAMEEEDEEEREEREREERKGGREGQALIRRGERDSKV